MIIVDEIRFLFVPWGNPYYWKVTRYSFQYECKKTAESFTTLPILTDCLDPDYIVIIALDTLAPYVMGQLKRDIDYYDVVEYARESVVDKLDKLAIKLKGLKVEILPGIGKYNYRVQDDPKKASYEGMITDYKYSLAYFMAKHFMDRLEKQPPDISIRIALDLTHGVNYMPTFTYDILLSLSRILRYKFSNVSFEVYNTDPFSTSENIHYINKVVHVNNLSREPINEMLTPEHGRLIKINDPDKAQLIREIKLDIKQINQLNIFAGAVINGLPLAILTFYPDIESIMASLDRVVDLYARNTEVYIFENELRVVHPIAFSKGVEILSKVGLLGTLIRDYVDQPHDGYYSLDSLLKIAKIYDVSTRNYYLIHREIGKIKSEILDKYLEKSGLKQVSHLGPISITRDYREYLFEEKYTLGDKASFIRNYLSHAGLEKNITEIKLVLDKDAPPSLYLRYNLDREIEISSKKIKLIDLIREAALKDLIEIKI